MTRRAMEFGIRPHLLRGRVKHLYGPQHVSTTERMSCSSSPSCATGRCTSGRSWSITVQSVSAHCVFLDTGSTDDTVDRLCSYPDVTVLQTDAPYASSRTR